MGQKQKLRLGCRPPLAAEWPLKRCSLQEYGCDALAQERHVDSRSVLGKGDNGGSDDMIVGMMEGAASAC